MSSVNTFLVQDDRLLVTDQVKYAVLKGSANNTVVPYQAISGTNTADPAANTLPSSLTWNIQVPSQEVVIDRRAMVNYLVTIRYRKTSGAVGADVDRIWSNSSVVIGATTSGCDSLNVFPVSQCIQTIQATINNTTVAQNVQDTINELLRMHDSRELSEYMGLAPYLVDRMGIYNNAANSATSFQAPGLAILDESFVPRSAFPVAIRTAGAANSAIANNDADVFVDFSVWEPLFVSPFIWANPKVNAQGIYGVQNISIVMNLGTYDRMVRAIPQFTTATGAALTRTSVVGVAFKSAQLYLNYLTPQPSSVMVPRNVVPYYEAPRYYLSENVTLAASTFSDTLNTLSRVQSAVVRSNNLQLNQIPDKLILCMERIQVAGASVNTTTSLPSAYGAITQLSMNFNNQSGLLSTWSQKDLFQASRDAGSKQSWYEFSGQIEAPANIQDGFQNGLALPVGSKITGGSFANGQAVNLPTSGSLVILQFGKDIELPDYYAPGSIGNFNLQLNVNFEHYAPASCVYRLLVITINSGVFVTEKGTSNPYTALLRKEDVLNASSQEALGCHEFNRMVGGGFFDTLKSIGSTAWKYGKPILKALAPVAQSLLSQSSDPRAQMASKGIGVASKFLGDGMGAGMGAGERLMKHAKGSGYAF
jgi:hypothetical protein